MQGRLFVITGSSGVGKGTLRKEWLDGQDVFYSVSCTTREPRDGEIDGIDYYFVSEEYFDNLIKENGFLEYAKFVGNSYGTPIGPIKKALEEGRDVVLEIEVQGAQQIKDKINDAVLIFILPPNLQELRSRLEKRNTDSAEKIEMRMRQALEEIKCVDMFDHTIVNDDLDQAVRELIAIQNKYKSNN